jgi:threonine dehydrogenase-like Zn-dependent dehydrogenase
MRVVAYYSHDDIREEEWPKPDPGPGEVRVAIKSVCICGSDLTQYATGAIGNLKTPVPFLLGHEAAGLVDAVGAGVTGLPEGTPVAVEPSMPCGVCELCRAGRQNICPDHGFLGAPPVNGTLAEYIIIPAENALPVKARVSYAEIALVEPLAIGLYAAQILHVRPGDTVAVIGAGGIGQSCLIAAKLSGARVVAVTDRVASRLAVAEKYGAENVINCSDGNAVDEIMLITNGKGIDAVFEAAGESEALHDAITCAAVGARIGIIGIPHEENWTFPAAPARRKELLMQNVRRSNHTAPLAVELVERGEVDLSGLVSHRMPWEQAEEAFAMAERRDEGTLRITLEPEEPEEPFYP